jgi:hypothetical protein
MTEAAAAQPQPPKQTHDPSKVANLAPHVRDAIEALERDIAGRLAEIRGNRSQRQWAHDLGVFCQNINRYENGTIPHPDFFVVLALVEHVDLHWLLLGEGKPYRTVQDTPQAPAPKRSGVADVVNRYVPKAKR